MELRKYILKICVSPQSRRLSCGAVFDVKAIVLCCGLWVVVSALQQFSDEKKAWPGKSYLLSVLLFCEQRRNVCRPF